jgi:hypothetical protein
MLTSSITGAGLVIAFYALIAKMSDSIFSCRFALLEEKKREVEQIRSNLGYFSEENLDETSSRLKELSKEIDSMKVFPRYLAVGVGSNFLLFLITAIYSFNWLYGNTDPYAATPADYVLILFYMVSIGLFICVGFFGLVDVRETMKIQFKNLAKKKTELKEEIMYAPKEAETLALIKQHLIALKVKFETSVMVKTPDGKLLRPDLIIPSAENPKFLVEVMTQPYVQTIFERANQYEHYKADTGVETILVANFKGNITRINTARSYWDHVIDSDEMEKMPNVLKSILKK